LENNETQIITTFLDEENQINSSLSEFILVIGNEGHGIDRSIKLLPHKNKKLEIKFDSLNVAIATGIIIHELV
ncbi:MAG: hypothetical protein JJV90_00525, partial [Spiroplasma sp.]|nr:hypothetical protein [Mycoplasmatales bacterium]